MVGRADLAPGYRLAQSVHAAIAFALDWPDLARAHETVVCLVAPDECALASLADEVDCVRFYEPDLGGALTAIACIPFPETRKHFRKLPLDSGQRGGEGVIPPCRTKTK